MSVRDNIAAGKYKNTLQYPSHADYVSDNKKYKNIITEYREQESRHEATFKVDLFEENGVLGNPKAELAYNMAWDHGHASGLEDVAIWFEKLVELIK